MWPPSARSSVDEAAGAIVAAVVVVVDVGGGDVKRGRGELVARQSVR